MCVCVPVCVGVFVFVHVRVYVFVRTRMYVTVHVCVWCVFVSSCITLRPGVGRDRIIEIEYDIPSEPQVTDACKDLLRRLLSRADQRITVDEIRQHPWFRAGVMNVDDIWKYNEMCMMLDPHMHDNYQTMEDITNVLRQASLPLAADDQLIDCMADNVSPESSMSVQIGATC